MPVDDNMYGSEEQKPLKLRWRINRNDKNGDFPHLADLINIFTWDGLCCKRQIAYLGTAWKYT